MNDTRLMGSARRSPAFATPLHVGRPNLGDRERLRSRIDTILDSHYLTNGGPFATEFERRVGETVGAGQCVLTTNATIGLELAIRALGLRGEVIVPSFTFIATVHVLAWLGLRPVFCDVDPQTYTIDPRAAEELVTTRTSAIFGVHVFGQPCDTAGLATVAAKHGLTLLYDAAHAFGCSHHGRPIGQFGQAEVFSFHATKFINSAEGGAIVTSDVELADRLRLMRNFGFSTYDTVSALGTNAKMNEVSAAIGLTNLESVADFIALNRRNHAQYSAALARVPGIKVGPPVSADERNYQYVVIEVDPDQAGVTRDELQLALHAENVLVRRYFHPGCHRSEPYRSMVDPDSWGLVNTERISARVLCLPTGTQVGADDIDIVCEIIATAIADAQSGRRLVPIAPFRPS